jgi:ubiquinone/menaquinone biosynthesis C-methylase UbiE
MQNVIEHEIAHGKKISENAEEIWGWGSKAGQLRAQRRADYFINLGKIKQDDTVLEIGCGTGIFTQKVYDSTKAHITAIDISDDLLKQASAKMPEVNFRIDDAMNLSFQEGSFNVVFGSSILHHLDFKKSLGEIFRVMKPEGRMIFAEPNMLNPQIFIQKNVPIIKRWMGDSPDETAVVSWRMKKLLMQIGFKNVQVFPYDFLHPSIPAFCINPISAIGLFFEKVPVIKEIAGSVVIYAEK